MKSCLLGCSEREFLSVCRNTDLWQVSRRWGTCVFPSSRNQERSSSFDSFTGNWNRDIPRFQVLSSSSYRDVGAPTLAPVSPSRQLTPKSGPTSRSKRWEWEVRLWSVVCVLAVRRDFVLARSLRDWIFRLSSHPSLIYFFSPCSEPQSRGRPLRISSEGRPLTLPKLILV